MDTVAAAPFRRDLAAECRTAFPLGAYACAGEVHYLFLGSGGPYALSSPRYVDGVERALPSFSSEFPVFGWDEREMADERAVRWHDLADRRPLRGRHGEMPSAIVVQGNGLMHFVVGPVHAGVIEPGRFTFSSGGETIAHLDAQLGYAHRGIESHLEGREALSVAPAIARICGSCSAARSYAYARALETLAGVDVPEQVELARLAVLELERIYNHLGDLAASASGAGWAPGFTRGMALKEQAMRMCELAGGHRLLFDAIVPGGVGPVLSDPRALRAELDAFEKSVERYLSSLFSNASVVSRWQRAGTVTHEIARTLGAVGPAARASRAGIDVRSGARYGAYARLAFRAAAGSSGDVFARCRVKRDELRESLRLLGAALWLLDGWTAEQPQRLDVAPGRAYATVEGPRGAETVALHVDANRRIARVHFIAASYRNWPVVAAAMAENIVPDFPLVNKSFNLCYACADR